MIRVAAIISQYDRLIALKQMIITIDFIKNSTEIIIDIDNNNIIHTYQPGVVNTLNDRYYRLNIIIII